MRIVYLLHFSPPFHHAKHYLGVTRGSGAALVRRLLEHQHGEGANLTRHARRAGCLFILARIWTKAPFAFERALKRTGGSSRYCPICCRTANRKPRNRRT